MSSAGVVGSGEEVCELRWEARDGKSVVRMKLDAVCRVVRSCWEWPAGSGRASNMFFLRASAFNALLWLVVNSGRKTCEGFTLVRASTFVTEPKSTGKISRVLNMYFSISSSR